MEPTRNSPCGSIEGGWPSRHMPRVKRMLKQFEYLIEGIHIPGRKFVQEFVVFAMDEEEALAEP